MESHSRRRCVIKVIDGILKPPFTGGWCSRRVEDSLNGIGTRRGIGVYQNGALRALKTPGVDTGSDGQRDSQKQVISSSNIPGPGQAGRAKVQREN